MGPSTRMAYLILLSGIVVMGSLQAGQNLANGGNKSIQIKATTISTTPTAEHLSKDSTLGDLLSHPAFQGFAQHLLPWDDRQYDLNLPIRNIGSLMPYHSVVNPDDIVGALNVMIDQAKRGHAIFYDIYSEKEKLNDPAKANAGLFFFKGKPGAPFAVILPGGGFAYVGSLHEGFPIAQVVAEHGYNAFVLKYRAGLGAGVATQDLATAISFLFKHQRQLEIGIDHYSVWGASAGARMAATIGSHGPHAFGGDALPRPVCVVMLYTGHSEYSRNEPATFAVVGEDDWIARPSTMQNRVNGLKKAGTPVEFHVYPMLGHGFALGTGTSAQGWVDGAIQFWQNNAVD